MKILFAILLIGLFSIQSCIITNTPGFYSGYKKLTSNDQARIQFIPLNQAIPDTNKNLIYAVNAQSVLKSIQNKDTSVVYIWGPRCRSRFCLSLKSVQEECSNKGYNLLVVAEYYDTTSFKQCPQLNNPLISINHKFYKTDYCQKYTSLFTNELRQGKQISDSCSYYRYLMFNGSHFIRMQKTLGEGSI